MGGLARMRLSTSTGVVSASFQRSSTRPQLRKSSVSISTAVPVASTGQVPRGMNVALAAPAAVRQTSRIFTADMGRLSLLRGRPQGFSAATFNASRPPSNMGPIMRPASRAK